MAPACPPELVSRSPACTCSSRPASGHRCVAPRCCEPAGALPSKARHGAQIATIGLAASTDVYGVTLGGILGHALCTGAAVLGGRQLAAHINERTVSVLGGLLFIAFGLHGWWTGVPE
jgi:hypothetical protein